jgi:hypothetical protein
MPARDSRRVGPPTLRYASRCARRGPRLQSRPGFAGERTPGTHSRHRRPLGSIPPGRHTPRQLAGGFGGGYGLNRDSVDHDHVPGLAQCEAHLRVGGDIGKCSRPRRGGEHDLALVPSVSHWHEVDGTGGRRRRHPYVGLDSASLERASALRSSGARWPSPKRGTVAIETLRSFGHWRFDGRIIKTAEGGTWTYSGWTDASQFSR